MSSTPTSQNIYTVIDNLDSKLSRRGQIIEDGNYYDQYQEIKPNKTNIINTDYEIKNTTPINIMENLNKSIFYLLIFFFRNCCSS